MHVRTVKDFIKREKGVYAFISLFVFLCSWLSGSVVVGILAVLFYVVFSTYQVVRWGYFGHSILSRIVFGWMFILGISTLIMVAVYFLLGISAMSAFVSSLLITLVIIFFPESDCRVTEKVEIDIDPWLMIFLFADISILVLCILARTDDALVSPWLLFNGELFVLFFISTTVYLFAVRKYSIFQTLALGTFHVFIALCVSVIVYKIGFGFDPFIHRAAERAMIADGFIEPRQLLYVGQYVFIAIFSKLTNISVHVIDVWYVPIFASLSLPLTTYLGLREGFNLKSDNVKTWWMAVFIYPFMLLTFSVPFTFTYVIFLNILFSGFALLNRERLVNAIMSISVFTFSVFHPLLCVPLGFWLLINAFKNKWLKRLSLVFVGLSLPILLTYYQLTQGQSVHLLSLLENTDFFFNLFRNPFYDPYPYIPIHLDILYSIRYWLPYVMVITGSSVGIFTWKRYADQWKWLLSLIIGLMFAIYLISTLFIYKDIIVHEQAEFALRLLHVWYGLFLVPCIVGLCMITRKVFKYVAWFFVGSLITIAWYFSYPQFNLQFPFYSPSVSGDDVEIVHLINSNADDSFVVLSNQLTSAASLQEFGFDQYVMYDDKEILRYAIPTGGVLYPYYSQLFSGEDPLQVINKLFEHTDVADVYLVTHAYWNWSSQQEKLKKVADEVIRGNSGQITIYKFKRYEENTNTN